MSVCLSVCPSACMQAYLQNDAGVIVQGHYGEVLKGQYTDENGRVQDVAIKRLKQTMYEKFAVEFDKEFSIMIQLQHPNIVRIIGQSDERTPP